MLRLIRVIVFRIHLVICVIAKIVLRKHSKYRCVNKMGFAYLFWVSIVLTKTLSVLISAKPNSSFWISFLSCL